MTCKHSLSLALPPQCNTLIREWLKEDLPSFDYAALAVGDKYIAAEIILKNISSHYNFIQIAGEPFIDILYHEIIGDGCKVIWSFPEKYIVSKNDLEANGQRLRLALIKGPAHKVLQGERLALNILARASGIATQATRATQIVASNSSCLQLAGTRKTTPGFRFIEKYALMMAGIQPHRQDLSQMIMLKDNHIEIAGGISQAFQNLKIFSNNFAIKVEVECHSVEEALEALDHGANIVMLDNQPVDGLEESINLIRQVHPKAMIEVSGGIDMDNLKSYSKVPGIDIISMGCLTTKYPFVDLSMYIVE